MNLNDLLKKYEFQFNKQFGQNFISDNNLLSAIVNDSQITKDDIVVEIGAGAGTLTQEISARAKKVIAFEIDRNLKSILNDNLNFCNNVELIFEDALKYSIEKLLKLTDGQAFKVVANLPYYITTPIIMKFIENADYVKSLTVMVQYEVAKRFVAIPGTKDYGAITVAIDYVSDPQITRKVNRNMFFPQPNVDSAVVYMPIEKKYQCDYKQLRRLVRAGFNMRRKTLVNNLINEYKINRIEAEELLSEAGIDKNIRAEVLDVKQFVKLNDIITESNLV